MEDKVFETYFQDMIYVDNTIYSKLHIIKYYHILIYTRIAAQIRMYWECTWQIDTLYGIRQ